MKHKKEQSKNDVTSENDMYRMDRRTFVKIAGATAGALALGNFRFIHPAYGQVPVAQTPLPGNKIPQFINPLPTLSVAGGTMQTVIAGASQIELHMREFVANMLPTGFVLPNGLPYGGTFVWGYIEGTSIPAPAAPLDTYLGPVIIATRGNPTEIKFVNDLGNTIDSQVPAWVNSTDQTLHWADPLNNGANACAMGGIPAPGSACAQNYAGPVPAVVHLHGGEVPPVLDGGPDAWFTSDGAHKGHAYYTKAGAAGNEAIYRYSNSQEAAPIWFHDHVLGITRLNVYAGLAGAYPIIDPNLQLPTGLHPIGLGADIDGLPENPIIPLVIQDRMFDTNGQLFFPNVGLNPEHPFWVPEFVGDTIAVNGKTWPFLNVQPKRYRFLFLNGSNARAYELFFINRATGGKGPAMWVIGTDGGYLDAPVKIDPNVKPNDKLVIMPGERYDVIIDFAGHENTSLEMRNTARTPYPNGAPVNGRTTGRIMRFNVGPGPVTDNTYNPSGGAPLRQQTPVDQRIVRLVDPVAGALATGVTPTVTRQLTLVEVMGPGGPLEVLVNNTRWDGKSVDTATFLDGVRPDFTQVDTEYFSELPSEGDTELWEIINLTADAHPIHTHLTQFQLMNREDFDVKGYNAVYNAAFPGGVFVGGFGPPLDYNTGLPLGQTGTPTGILGGNPDVTPFLSKKGPIPPAPNEAGWKDTTIMLPGQVTRIVVRYTPTDYDPAKGAASPSPANYPFNPDGGHGFVWHCHIIDHEDNEMMRPYSVIPKPGATRNYNQGTEY